MTDRHPTPAPPGGACTSIIASWTSALDIQHQASGTTAEEPGPRPLSAALPASSVHGRPGPSLCAEVHRLKIQATPSSSVQIADCRGQIASTPLVSQAAFQTAAETAIATCVSNKPTLALLSTMVILPRSHHQRGTLPLEDALRDRMSGAGASSEAHPSRVPRQGTSESPCEPKVAFLRIAP